MHSRDIEQPPPARELSSLEALLEAVAVASKDASRHGLARHSDQSKVSSWYVRPQASCATASAWVRLSAARPPAESDWSSSSNLHRINGELLQSSGSRIQGRSIHARHPLVTNVNSNCVLDFARDDHASAPIRQAAKSARAESGSSNLAPILGGACCGMKRQRVETR